ncbi:MAG: hypothetical protein ACT4OZ_02770 [Gemmatimonadota bacterium]
MITGTASMTPEGAVFVAGVSAAGSWTGREVRVRGTLVIGSGSAAVTDGDDRLLVVAYDELTDATLQASVLTLHSQRGRIAMHSNEGLAAAWARIVSFACAAPEVTRGLRALGRAASHDAGSQKQFFAPLISARRRLHEAGAPEQRLAHVDTKAIRARLGESLANMAAGRYPSSPPDRRALEAVLDEATEGLFAELESLEALAELVRSAPDGTMFTRWRAWTRQLRQVFREADRSWRVISEALKREEGARRG